MISKSEVDIKSNSDSITDAKHKVTEFGWRDL